MRKAITPAILASTPEEFEQKLRFNEKYFKLLQIDILDGSMGIKNTSFYNLPAIKKMKPKLDFELHLMVDFPEKILADWAGYSKLKRAVIHYESFTQRKKDLYDIIQLLKRRKIKVGLAINPNTPVSKIIEFLPNLDVLVVMGVNPGWSGQKFIPSVLSKIRDVRSHYPKLGIGVDGGVTEDNFPEILAAGANILYAASLIYRHMDNPRQLKALIKKVKK